MYKKPIIVFEGIEGSGKTHHINNLEKFFKKKKIKYIKFREPGGSKNSENIRNLMLNKKSKYEHMTDLFLYMAARNENYNKIIKKNFRKKIILIDRFVDSTIAYQHYGMGLDKLLINKINKIILKNIKPNLTILNIVSMENLSKRLNLRKNKNRYDSFNLFFYNKVQNGFVKISRSKSNYLIIDSNKELVENKKKVLNCILKKIK